MKFKNQPWGNCFECRWNRSTNYLLDCEVGQTRVTNPFCIMKIIMTHLSNIAIELEHDNGTDGEDWKNGDSR